MDLGGWHVGPFPWLTVLVRRPPVTCTAWPRVGRRVAASRHALAGLAQPNAYLPLLATKFPPRRDTMPGVW